MEPSLYYVSFLLFIIATHSISSTTSGTAAAVENAVRDATGKKVLNNVPYRLGPVTLANGGSVKLTNTTNNKKICPFNVVQGQSVVVNDTFMFTHTYKRPKYLLTSRILGIDSGPYRGSCTYSTFWTIPDPEAKAPGNLITTGGPFEDETTCFQVVEYPKPTNPKVRSYMLQHCPSFCGAGTPMCYNISSYVDKGVRRFASRGTPFEFVFHKVSK